MNDINQKNRPEKILPFEIDLEMAREIVREYFANAALEYKDEIINLLEPIYLPYWMCDCMCEAEYDCVEFSKHRYGTYTQTSKVECNGILLDASTKIDNKLSDQIDLFYDLSKLKDYDEIYLAGARVYECDINFNSASWRLKRKIEEEVIEGALEFEEFANNKKINISDVKTMYVYLPCYYIEINGLKLMINGQSGNIVINSKKYLKKRKHVLFEKFLYKEKIQNNLHLISFVGMIITIAIMAVCCLKIEHTSAEIGKDIFEIIGIIVQSLLMVAGIILGGVFFAKYKIKNLARKDRYVKKIEYKRMKEVKSSPIFKAIEIIIFLLIIMMFIAIKNNSLTEVIPVIAVLVVGLLVTIFRK